MVVQITEAGPTGEWEGGPAGAGECGTSGWRRVGVAEVEAAGWQAWRGAGRPRLEDHA